MAKGVTFRQAVLGAGPVEQLTQIQPFGTGRQEPKPADPKTSQGTLQIQEKNLIGAVRDRIQRRDMADFAAEADPPPNWLQGARSQTTRAWHRPQ